MTDPVGRREWERRWQTRSGPEFGWYLAEPPHQVRDLLTAERLPAGGALDVACGDGIVTRFLAQSRSPAVGFDVAEAAVVRAVGAARDAGSSARFVVGDGAAGFPFSDGAFALVFDRGGLQNLPKATWPGYFRDVERVLVPGGMLQLLFSGPQGRVGLLRRTIRALRGVRRADGEETARHVELRSLAGPGLQPVLFEDFAFRLAGGKVRRFTHALFEKASANDGAGD